MRVLLVKPARSPRTLGGEDVFMFEPLELEYLAAGLVAHHDVRILDMRIEPDLVGCLESFQPDVVGFTAYTVNVNTVKYLAGRVKRWSPDIVTIVGGHHATVVPEDFLEPDIDLIVQGEGVSVLREIVERLEKGRTVDDLPGVVCVREGNLIRSPYEQSVDLDALPFPARDLTRAYRSRYFCEWMKPLASLRTSKGCPFRCNFCALWNLTGGKYLKRSPERIVEELAQIEEPWVFFADDESLVDAKRMDMLASAIEKAGIRKRYFLYGRSDTIARHPELVQHWKDIGLERVFVGVESFRAKDLETVNKGSKVEDNERAIQILDDAGVDIYASFIVMPDYDHADFEVLRQRCRSLPIGFASFAILTPFPGTGLYRDVQDQLVTDQWDYWDLLHPLTPTRLPMHEFYDEMARLLLEALPPARSLALLRKFPLRDIPTLLARTQKIVSAIKETGRFWSPPLPRRRERVIL